MGAKFRGIFGKGKYLEEIRNEFSFCPRIQLFPNNGKVEAGRWDNSTLHNAFTYNLK